MTLLTQDRRLILYDRDGVAYRPVRDGGTGRSIFKIKPEGASNRAEDAIHTEHWLEVARAMLVDGLAARCKALRSVSSCLIRRNPSGCRRTCISSAP